MSDHARLPILIVLVLLISLPADLVWGEIRTARADELETLRRYETWRSRFFEIDWAVACQRTSYHPAAPLPRDWFQATEQQRSELAAELEDVISLGEGSYERLRVSSERWLFSGQRFRLESSRDSVRPLGSRGTLTENRVMTFDGQKQIVHSDFVDETRPGREPARIEGESLPAGTGDFGIDLRDRWFPLTPNTEWGIDDEAEGENRTEFVRKEGESSENLQALILSNDDGRPLMAERRVLRPDGQSYSTRWRLTWDYGEGGVGFPAAITIEEGDIEGTGNGVTKSETWTFERFTTASLLAGREELDIPTCFAVEDPAEGGTPPIRFVESLLVAAPVE